MLTYFLLKKYNLFHYNDTGSVVVPESVQAFIKLHKDDHKQNKHGQHGHHKSEEVAI